MKKTIQVVVLIVMAGYNLLSQTESNSDSLPSTARKSKFLTGFYVGSLFPNKYSAQIYNGYGFDLAGSQNTFSNSLMYQKIINEYGGGYNQFDYVAQALGVEHNQWNFDESDMPVNMHYNVAIMVGFNFKIPVNRKNAFIININASKLGIEGNFTMSILKPQIQPQTPGSNNNTRTFAILGREQRALFELGYQHLFGDDEKLNFLTELGFVGTLAKYEKNWIYINNLQIDLTSYWNNAINTAAPAYRPVGFGVGAFASVGINANINPRITFQILYTLSHEKINLGINPRLKLQNALGIRVYYNF